MNKKIFKENRFTRTKFGNEIQREIRIPIDKFFIKYKELGYDPIELIYLLNTVVNDIQFRNSWAVDLNMDITEVDL